VRCVGVHIATGATVGYGVGECSSGEEKYKWRRAVTSDEFEATDASRRRIKYGYDNLRREAYQVPQVRVEPADVANTILKMAKKRAQIDLVLTAFAASDIFAQDLEDMPPELRESVAGDDRPRQQSTKPATAAPQARANGSPTPASEKQVGMLRARIRDAGIEENAVLAQFELGKLEEIPKGRVNDALAFIRAAGQ
jgi:hypothetical protein